MLNYVRFIINSAGNLTMCHDFIFLHQGKIWDYPDCLYDAFPLSAVAHRAEGGMRYSQRRRRGQELPALSAQRGLWGSCGMGGEQLPWSRSREMLNHPRYHFPSWEQDPQIFFYRTSMSFLNQHPIAGMQQRIGTQISCQEMWVQISPLALTEWLE